MKMARSIPVLSSVCFSLVATTLAAWAENYPLDSIDFDSQGQRTHITLHTGSIVPVDKILVSRDKMMIDIDQVDATQTIRTNFANAENISHVVIQPLNDHKVRLIIRGENMESPSIAFDKIDSGSNERSSLVTHALSERQPTPIAVKAKPAVKSQAVMTTPQAASAKAVSNALSDPELASDPSLDSTLDENYVAPIVAPKTAHTPTVTRKTLSDMPAPTGLIKEDISVQEPAAATNSTDLLQKVLSKLPAGALNFIPYGALFLVLSALGLLVGQKFRAHKKNADENLDDQEWMESVGSDAGRINGRQSFREMANAYRTRHQGSIPEPRSTSISEPQRREDIIGLGAMQPGTSQTPALPKTSAAQLAALKAQLPSKKDGFGAQQLEKMLDIIQKEATGKAAPASLPAPQPKKRGVNPYVPPVANRANEIQKAASQARNNAISAPAVNRPVNRAAAAGPTKQQVLSNAEKTRNALNSQGMNNQQGPLPSNPQVLDFLRNVADLMEKEGKPAIAQNIQRNLGSQSKLPR